VRIDCGIAFAGSLLDARKVQDMDVASRIRDHFEFLQILGDGIDAAALHAHHLGEEFLRQIQIVADEALHSQQPFAGAIADRVSRITRRRLLDLR
jgi:hypothetical protein